MLSIIVPYHNSGDRLTHLIASLEQQQGDYEVIFVDDSSSPAERAKLENATKSLSWAHTILLDANQGPGNARNIGLEHAQGDWITFLDSDDLFFPDTVEIILKTVNRSHVDVLLFNYVVKKDGRITQMSILPGFGEGFVDPVQALLHTKSSSWCKVYNRDLLNNPTIRFANLRLNEDTVFTKVALSYADSVYYVTKPLYIYEQHDGSLTHRLKHDIIRHAVRGFHLIEKNINPARANCLEYLFITETVLASAMVCFTVGMTNQQVRALFASFDKKYPQWYKNSSVSSASLRYRVLFFLIKYRLFILLRIYNSLFRLARGYIGLS